MAFDRRRRALAAALIFLVTVIAMEAMSVAPILPAIEDDLGGLAWYGWVFAAFALAQILAIPITGQWVDRTNPATPLVAGILSFVAGLVVAATAVSMPMLVGGRVLQGFGAGVVPAVAYVCVGRGFEESERPRVFALMSTAWVVPSVVGPAFASVVTEQVGWRWVFGGLIPVTAIAGGLAVPAVAALGRSTPATDVAEQPSSTGPAFVLVAGATAMIAGFQQELPGVIVPLAALGIAVSIFAYRRLTPPGTLRAAEGLPAAVLLKGVLTCAFFAADAFVPLTMTDIRGTGTAYSGFVFAVAAFTWTGASWVQAKVIDRTGPRVLIRSGMVTIAGAVALMLLVALETVPVWVAVIAWAFGGFGIGLSYAPLSLVVLARAEPGREGFATAAMQLSDALGVAVGTGLGGAIVATSERWDRGVDDGIAVVFVCSIAIALIGAALAVRIPRHVSTDTPTEPALGAAGLQPEPL